MEVSALKHAGVAGRHGRSPLLRLQSDERLIELVRRGSEHAFEALVARYHSRLLAFCRHMLGSREDAEDVLQEVFAAAYNAIQADDRPINARPWLYRIARNRSLNHLRRAQAIGVDSMDVHLSENGQTTADKVHKREDFRALLEDVRALPETQRTALLLREMEALTYDQIAIAMETTIPSVKSLLVRARVSLAEAAEARKLSCDQVRLELGEVAEGLRMRPDAAVRRHLRSCERCAAFRVQLRHTNKALAAVFPVGPLLLLKKLVLAHFGTSAGAGGGATAAGTAAGTAATTAAGTTAGTMAASSALTGMLSTGVSTVASKAAAGMAAAALVTAGAVEVKHVAIDPPPPVHQSAPAQAAVVHYAAPAVAERRSTAETVAVDAKAATIDDKQGKDKKADDKAGKDKVADKVAGQDGATPPGQQPAAGAQPAPAAAPPATQVDGDTTTLPTPAGPAPIQPTGSTVPPSPAPAATPPPEEPKADPPADNGSSSGGSLAPPAG